MSESYTRILDLFSIPNVVSDDLKNNETFETGLKMIATFYQDGRININGSFFVTQAASPINITTTLIDMKELDKEFFIPSVLYSQTLFAIANNNAGTLLSGGALYANAAGKINYHPSGELPELLINRKYSIAGTMVPRDVEDVSQRLWGG